MRANFDFLTLDLDTAELLSTINKAEENYTHGDYEGTLVKVRKVAENTAKLIADREYIALEEYMNFNQVLLKIKPNISSDLIITHFYAIKDSGNKSAHVLNAAEATKENALKALKQMFEILAWVMITYIDPDIKEETIGKFLEPRAQELYRTAERKFVYVQTVNNENGLFNAYEGTQKIGEGSVPTDDLEADWRANSAFLREHAGQRIRNYMTTSGLPYTIGWVELAYKKSTKEWFHDYDVHEVLNRSGIEKADLTGNEWYKVDLETAKEAIKAVKEGRSSLNIHGDNPQEKEIVLRPEQQSAVDQTRRVFGDKNKKKMLWDAKMRFGKTITSLELVKQEKFQKVLIVTHRPVVADSWFEDFYKMKLDEAGYRFGSVDKGERLRVLKESNQPFVYFASIQLLRHDKGKTNLQKFADVDWDLIIIDEAHEGTQTENADYVMKALLKEKTKTLELSGTPFNLLDNYEEDTVYTWDYVMEQSAKKRWDLEKPNEPNPYESLPKVSMYTFEMKDKAKYEDESKSFNFREFFRVDEQGKLVHEADVRHFLDNITNYDSHTNYPFSTPTYRETLRHTLWLLPGVKEANALEDLMKQHKVFGSEYEIVNVVRGSATDDGIANEADLEKVRHAITKDPSQTKTITLTVRKLTTGVNIPEWTAVLFLSNTNSAMSYLQAAFRAQTPFSHEKLGMKTNCYVFDFAPDRALTVMAESAQINSGVGKKNTHAQKQAMTQLLNFMPILGNSETGMKTFDVDRMLTQLKKAYAEKAVRSGFEDDSLYNDNLLTVSPDAVAIFEKLQAIVGKQNRRGNRSITINDQGYSDEDYEKAQKAKKKKKRERTPEEQELIEKEKAAREQRKSLISILRGVSIRIPMMIYGMKIDVARDITLGDFIKEVDEASWKEFMPKGFTKGMFSEISKYYDAEVFVEAGRIIRQRAKSYDYMDFIERAEHIAELFGTFKNPDKETVLTPWRVVNLQIAKSVGGLNFYDDQFESLTDGATSNLHWVTQSVTDKVYQPQAKFLDINAKTGLYPLHSAISLYYQKVLQNDDNYFAAEKVYQDILANNIYAIAKTPMAKTITERTLAGYKNYKTNVVYIENLTDMLKDNIEKGKKAVEEAFSNVKFDVIIGNPPYQESATDKEMVAGQQQRVNNVFHLFQKLADEVGPKHSILIYPGGRWMQQSGRGMQEFGTNLINSRQLRHLIYYPNANEIFGEVAISDGISVVHKDYSKDSDTFEYSLVEGNHSITTQRNCPGESTFIIDPIDEKIVQKITGFVKKHHLGYLSASSTINQKLFQIESNFVEMNPDKVELYTGQLFNRDTHIKLLTNDKAGKAGRATWFVAKREVIEVRKELIDKYKVVVSSANAGGQKRDNQLAIMEPQTAFGRSRIALKMFDTEEEATNFYKYVSSNFIRFSFLLTDENLSSLAKLVIDLDDYSEKQTLMDFSRDIDVQFKELLGLTETEVERIKDRVERLR